MSIKIKRGIITAVCVALGSRISISVITEGFIIAMAVIILGLLMYSYNLLSPFATGLLVGVVSPTFRAVTIVAGSNIHPVESAIRLAISWTYPEIGFYITYGFVFWLFYKLLRRERNLKNYFFCMLCCDFFANMAEMFIRGDGHIAESRAVASLAAVSLVRSIIICFVLLMIEAYRSLLNKEEHEERYKKLMIMVSVFRSEIYFMNKNMAEIEDIMKKAFKMYKTLDEGDYPESVQEMSLDIAKDVHEIKKDYIKVIKGLQENFLADLDVDKMSIRDIVSILDADIKERILVKKIDAQFVTSVRTNFIVAEHFSLMSVLRNLVVNSLDAVGAADRQGFVQLTVSHDAAGERYVIMVKDNGIGINKDDMDVIYDAGYSTKFDTETGNIYRGVGLTMVRDLVRDRFHGEIEVESTEGAGTKFKIYIPEESVEKVAV